jgi:clan AA aspartic protease (TIGR02281 family)
MAARDINCREQRHAGLSADVTERAVTVGRLADSNLGGMSPCPERARLLAMKRSHFLWALVITLLTVTIGLPSVLAETVQLKADRGTFVVPVVVNGRITLDFIIDSGASPVVIPSDVLSTLTRTGTIAKSDYIGVREYQLADGRTERARRVRLRSLRVGSVEIKDVIASEAPEAGSLLLGQSFLSRLPSWAIDNQRNVLLINQVPADGAIPSRTPPSRQVPPIQAQAIPRSGLAQPVQTQAAAATTDQILLVCEPPRLFPGNPHEIAISETAKKLWIDGTLRNDARFTETLIKWDGAEGSGTVHWVISRVTGEYHRNPELESMPAPQMGGDIRVPTFDFPESGICHRSRRAKF